jgi:hypothetical protein
MTFPLLIGGAPSRYRINQSLRFRASNSARLSRTGLTSVTANRHVVSFWAKLGAGANQALFCGYSNGNNYTYCGTSASNQLTFSVANGGSTQVQFITNAVYRDPTAWYHVAVIVDTTLSTASDRFQIWVNGSRITSFATSTNTLAQNSGLYWGDNFTQYIGTFDTVTNYFDGYQAEFIFTGQMTTNPGVGSFGAFDPTTGAWVPRRYTGTYGTNGFYLPFNDAASTTTISQDRSGNGNNWTSSGISVTSGVTFDQMSDTPTNGTAGTRPVGNYATLNPLAKLSGDTSAANMRYINTSGSTAYAVVATQPFSADASDLSYVEVTLLSAPTAGYPYIGFWHPTTRTQPCPANQIPGFGAFSDFGHAANGGYYINNAYTSNSNTYTTNDVVMVARKRSTGEIWMGKNGTWWNSGNPSAQTSPYATITANLDWWFSVATAFSAEVEVNFGQKPFVHTPPTNFRGLCTANLSTPTIPNGASAFQATLRTGTGATASVTSLAFQPDLVWIKGRSGATDHGLYDSARGVQNQLESNTTTAETVEATGLTAFSSSGYTVGALAQLNTNTATYVDWAWREGAAYGFDIVTYTGNGTSGRTVAHNLGVAPHMMVVKRRSGVAIGWAIYHRNQAATPQNNSMSFDTSATVVDNAAWNSTAPTSSVITLGNGAAVNLNTETYVAYLWTSIPGFSLFGSYTGNGSADGPFVWCGFRPRFVLIKGATVATSWVVYDAARNTFNVVNNALYPNLSIVEDTAPGDIDITANGFKLREGGGTSTNNSGETYIFAAFAENPFKFANAR